MSLAAGKAPGVEALTVTSLPVFRGSWKHPRHFQSSFRQLRDPCAAACPFCWLFWKALVIACFRISFPFYTNNIPITLKHIFPLKKKVRTESGIAFY